MAIGETFGFFLVEDPNTTALALPPLSNDRLAIVRGAAPNQQTYFVSPLDLATTAPAVMVATPASGATLVVPAGEKYLYVDTAGLAALTIQLPPPSVGGYIEICLAAPVTALTIQDNAAVPVPGAPTSGFGPGAAIVMRSINGIGWRPWK
jgi:hypothetical protein